MIDVLKQTSPEVIPVLPIPKPYLIKPLEKSRTAVFFIGCHPAVLLAALALAIFDSRIIC